MCHTCKLILEVSGQEQPLQKSTLVGVLGFRVSGLGFRVLPKEPELEVI